MSRPWSRLRMKLQSLWATSVVPRLDVHMTLYPHLKEEYGRVWITWDGKDVYGFDDAGYWRRVQSLADELRAVGENVDDAWSRATETAQAEGKSGVWGVVAAIEEYIDLQPAAAVASADPVVRGMALLDRRLGKRTWRALDLASDVHPLVRRMYDLRCEAEGWVQVIPTRDKLKLSQARVDEA